MITLIILHFIADFLFQSREMGKQKSSHWGYLTLHLMIQYLVFLPALGLTWSLVNALVHGLIDRNIWNLYKANVLFRLGLSGMDLSHPDVAREAASFKYWEDHWFFVTIGFDQMLHMITLAVIWGMM